MRYTRILRILSIAFILSLLVMALPATPAQALGTLILVPDEGAIGDTITVGGEGFNVSTESTDRYAAIYFSSQEATTLHDIDDEVTTYAEVDGWVYLNDEGEFEETFLVPDELNDGDDDEDVIGGTYYVYLCYYNVGTDTIAPRR